MKLGVFCHGSSLLLIPFTALWFSLLGTDVIQAQALDWSEADNCLKACAQASITHTCEQTISNMQLGDKEYILATILFVTPMLGLEIKSFPAAKSPKNGAQRIRGRCLKSGGTWRLLFISLFKKMTRHYEPTPKSLVSCDCMQATENTE